MDDHERDLDEEALKAIKKQCVKRSSIFLEAAIENFILENGVKSTINILLDYSEQLSEFE